jgi:hypothetical protein
MYLIDEELLFLERRSGNDPFRQLHIHREENLDSKAVNKKTWNRITASLVFAHEKLVS